MRPSKIHAFWWTQLRWNRERGSADIFSLTHQLVSLPSSLSTAQPLNKYWLYFRETNRKQNSVHSNHPVKAARNPHSCLFLLPCSDISGMEEKTFFPKGRSLKVLHLQRILFLPFLPGWPLNKSFSQEPCSLVIPSSGMLVLNTVGQALLPAF